MDGPARRPRGTSSSGSPRRRGADAAPSVRGWSGTSSAARRSDTPSAARPTDASSSVGRAGALSGRSRGSGSSGVRRAEAALEVAPDVDVRELPEDARRQLRTLPAALRSRVAGHLIMAARVLDQDSELAHAHAKRARQLAQRLAAVREATGVTAYRSGRYAEALAELRAARRMTGVADYLPMMADCERGLGRPDRALILTADSAGTLLDPAGRAELRIVAAGARRDTGQIDAALMLLQGPDLDPETIEPWTPRLWYAYADTLLAAGRRDEALRWFEAVTSVDGEGDTDAEERAAGLRLEAGWKQP